MKQLDSHQVCSVVDWGGAGLGGGVHAETRTNRPFPAFKCMHALYYMKTEAALHAIMGHLAVTGCCFNDSQLSSLNSFRVLRYLIKPLKAANAVQLCCQSQICLICSSSLLATKQNPDASCMAVFRLNSRLRCRADLHRGAKALGHPIEGLRGGIIMQFACVPGLLNLSNEKGVPIASCMVAFWA